MLSGVIMAKLKSKDYPWLEKCYYLYKFHKVEGDLIGYPIKLSEDDDGIIFTGKHTGISLSLTGMVYIEDNNICLSSSGETEDRYKFNATFKLPLAKNHIYRLWGTGYDIKYGHIFQVYKILLSSTKLNEEEKIQEFNIQGVNANNGVVNFEEWLKNYNADDRNDAHFKKTELVDKNAIDFDNDEKIIHLDNFLFKEGKQ